MCFFFFCLHIQFKQACFALHRYKERCSIPSTCPVVNCGGMIYFMYLSLCTETNTYCMKLQQPDLIIFLQKCDITGCHSMMTIGGSITWRGVKETPEQSEKFAALIYSASNSISSTILIGLLKSEIFKLQNYLCKNYICYIHLKKQILEKCVCGCMFFSIY